MYCQSILLGNVIIFHPQDVASELRAMGTQGSRCRTQSRLGASISSSRALARECLGRVMRKGDHGERATMRQDLPYLSMCWSRGLCIPVSQGITISLLRPSSSSQCDTLLTGVQNLSVRHALLYFIMGVLRGRLSLILRHLLRQENYYDHRMVGFLRLRNSLINND